MARRKRKDKEEKKTLTIGVVGRGQTDPKNAAALIKDFIKGQEADDVLFVFEVTNDWDEAQDALLDLVEDEEYSFHVAYDDDAADDSDLKEIIDAADESSKVQRPSVRVATIIAEAAEPKALVVLFDEEGDEDEDPGMAAIERVAEDDVSIYDITNGMDEVEIEEDEEGEPEESEEEEASDSASEGAPDVSSMSRAELKKRAEQLGLEFGQRTHTKTLQEMITNHYKGGGGSSAPKEASGGGQKAAAPSAVPVGGEEVVSELREIRKLLEALVGQGSAQNNQDSDEEPEEEEEEEERERPSGRRRRRKS